MMIYDISIYVCIVSTYSTQWVILGYLCMLFVESVGVCSGSLFFVNARSLDEMEHDAKAAWLKETVYSGGPNL